MEDTRAPEPTEEDPKRGVDYLESIVNGYEKEKLKRAAISGLLESVKGKKKAPLAASKKVFRDSMPNSNRRR